MQINHEAQRFLSPRRVAMLRFLLACLAFDAALGQRYAERNVLPAPSPSDASYDGNGEYDYDEDYNYEDGKGDPYGFREEDGTDVYKWNVNQYPHPLTAPKFCNRFKPSFVCDPDRVLGKTEADLLDDYIRKLYRETPCICESCEKEGEDGIVVGIALLKYMHHPYHMHHAKVVRTFTESLRARWKLGPCENDILIVVATTDRLSYTDVGRATSTYLSVHEAHRIFLENKAKFTANNFSEGLMDILQGYHRATRGMRRPLKDGRPGINVILVAGAIVGSVFLLGAVLFLAFVVYKKCKNRKDADDEVDEPEKRRSGTTVSSSWSKKDIKVLFGPEKSSPQRSSAEYQKCGTDENDATEDGTGTGTRDEEEMDFTLATPDDPSFPQDSDETRLTEVTTLSSSDPPGVDLEQELANATDGLIKKFPSTSTTNGCGNVIVTDI